MKARIEGKNATEDGVIVRGSNGKQYVVTAIDRALKRGESVTIDVDAHGFRRATLRRGSK